MGVPAFYRWLSEKYGKTIENVVEDMPPTMISSDGSASDTPNFMTLDWTTENPNGIEFDNLYIDMNGIIHPCAHPENDSAPPTEAHMYCKIMAYIDRLVAAVRPRRLLYLAIDGVAPRAKMNQQRSRRFRSAQEAEEQAEITKEAREYMIAMGHSLPNADAKPWDSNVITPGTKFMSKLSQYLRFYIRDRVNNVPGWKNIKVILSDASVPGEGEHKIMSYMRQQRAQEGYDPNQHHILHGLDADLIMLALATHEAKFTVLREEVLFGKAKYDKERQREQEAASVNAVVEKHGTKRKIDSVISAGLKPLQFLHVHVLREYLQFEFEALSRPSALPFKYEFERVVDDFVFLCFFVGNDFLPHLPCLDIRDGAVDFLLILYKKSLPSLGGYLTDCGVVNLSRVDVILAHVGKVEDEIFRRKRIKEERDKTRRAQQNTRRRGGGNDRIAARAALGQATAVEKRDKRVAPVKSVAENASAAQILKQGLDNGTSSSSSAPTIVAVPDPEEANKYIGKSGKEAVTARVKEMQEAKLEKCREEVKDVVQLGVQGWKDRYYSDKYKSDDIATGGGREKVYQAYVEGLCWVMKYYYEGCASWTWFYPFHYAPFASDLLNIDRFDIKFDKGKPFRPFEQLMGVFPAASSHALPVPYRNLMSDPESPIIDFYPTVIPVDPNGKAMPWLWVVLLPFIEEERLLATMATVESELKESEMIRNRRYGDELLFVHANHPMAEGLEEALASEGSMFSLDSQKAQSMTGVLKFKSEYFFKTGDTIPAPRKPAGELMDVANNRCLTFGYEMPEAKPHQCVVLEGVIPPPVKLSEDDRYIRIPRLGRGNISIIDLAGGAPALSGNSSSYDRQQRRPAPQGYSQYLAEGYRNWGSQEPRAIEKNRNGNNYRDRYQGSTAGRGGYSNGGRGGRGGYYNQGSGQYSSREGSGGYSYQQQQQRGGYYNNQRPQQYDHRANASSGYQRQQQRPAQASGQRIQSAVFQQRPDQYRPSSSSGGGSSSLDALRAGLMNMHQQRGTLPDQGNDAGRDAHQPKRRRYDR